MSFTLLLKALLSLAVGLIFWFWAFLVFMVYSFMPPSKIPNSIIFSVAAPVLYLVVLNFVLNRVFKEKGWKNYLANLVLTVVMTGLALGIIDLLARMVK